MEVQRVLDVKRSCHNTLTNIEDLSAQFNKMVRTLESLMMEIDDVNADKLEKKLVDQLNTSQYKYLEVGYAIKQTIERLHVPRQ